MPAYYYGYYPLAERFYPDLNTAKEALRAAAKDNYYIVNLKQYKPNKAKACCIIFKCSKASTPIDYIDLAYTHKER